MVDDAHLIPLSQRISQWTGLDVGSRLADIRRWIQTQVADGDTASLLALLTRLQDREQAVTAALIQSILISHTVFFRDAEQLQVVSALLTDRRYDKLRIWVAGCSSGEEAYTVALIANSHARAVETVATDISAESLAVAREGRYSRDCLLRIPAAHHGEFAMTGGFIHASARLRRSIRFVEHNLLQPPPKPSDAQGWDLILCRNVLVHFQADHAAATLQRLSSALAPGGLLLLGAGEFHHRTPLLSPVEIAGRILLTRTAEAQTARVSSSVGAPAIQPPPAVSTPVASGTAIRRSSTESLVKGKHLAVLLATGSLDLVLTDTLATLRANPEHQPALLLAGIAYHQKSRHHEATALLERSLAQHPSCWPAAHFLALSLDALGQKGAALAAFRCVKESQQPTPAAQALIDLLDFGPWRSEAVALARLRLGELHGPPSSCR